MRKFTSLYVLVMFLAVSMQAQIPGPNLNEGFEGGIIPDNWTVINADGGEQWWQASIDIPHNGTYGARVMYESPSLNNND